MRKPVLLLDVLLLDLKACRLGTDNACDRATEGPTEAHLPSPLWRHVLSNGVWASACHCVRWQDYLDKGLFPTLTGLTGWLCTDSSTGSYSFSCWVLGENKFWVLKNYRRRALYEGGRWDLGKVKTELWAPQCWLEAEGRWKAAGVHSGGHDRVGNIQSVPLCSCWGQVRARSMGRIKL